jgi:membrane-associated phospholipid phosphatase
MQETIILFFQSFSTELLDLIMELITMTGEQMLYITVVSYIVWNVSKPLGFALAFTLLSSTLCNGAIKLLVHSPRPYQVLSSVEGKRISTAEGFSFPSGHTQGATTFLLSGALYLNRRRWITAAAILSTAVALSRIYLGVHWPIDVLGALVLGTLFALLVFKRVLAIASDERLLARVNFLTGTLAGIFALVLSVLEMLQLFEPQMFMSMIKLLAILTGFSFGTYFERTQVDYIISGTRIVKLFRFVMGMLGALVILYGGKIILPDHVLSVMVRYAGTGFWAFFLYPLLGTHISTDREGDRLFTRSKGL